MTCPPSQPTPTSPTPFTSPSNSLSPTSSHPSHPPFQTIEPSWAFSTLPPFMTLFPRTVKPSTQCTQSYPLPSPSSAKPGRHTVTSLTYLPPRPTPHSPNIHTAPLDSLSSQATTPQYPFKLFKTTLPLLTIIPPDDHAVPETRPVPLSHPQPSAQ